MKSRQKLNSFAVQQEVEEEYEYEENRKRRVGASAGKT